MPDFSLPLSPHAAHGPGPLLSLAAAGSVGDGCLEVTFVMRGRVADVKLPAPSSAPCRKDGLWKHSCCEIFLGLDAGYLEFNFSPSRDWAAYRFEGYRAGQAALDDIEVAVEPCERFGDELRLQARARWRGNLRPQSRDWRLNACVIVEDSVGLKSYWALCHPTADPDFHHRASFTALPRSPGPC